MNALSPATGARLWVHARRDRPSAERPDRVWALDDQFDVTSTARTIKILQVVDEFTRESLANIVPYSIDADATLDALDKIVAARGTSPPFIRSDNGPGLTLSTEPEISHG